MHFALLHRLSKKVFFFVTRLVTTASLPMKTGEKAAPQISNRPLHDDEAEIHPRINSKLIRFLIVNTKDFGRTLIAIECMKTIFILAVALVAPSFAQTIYTPPKGYTRITIEAPDNPGETKLTSISATLLNDGVFSGPATLGTYTDNADPASDTHVINVTGVTWSEDQWTTEPHLAYITVADDPGNADGILPAQEAFLISSHDTSGALTLDTTYNLADKFLATTSVVIRKAQTVSQVLNSLSTGSAGFESADRVFVWDGDRWASLRFLAGNWRDADSPTTIVDDLVIFPDEGLFIQRTGSGNMTLTIFGEVPTAPQISTIKATGFLASRYPVETKLNNLGLQDSNWQGSDRVFIWNGTSWVSNRYLAGAWRDSDSPTTLTGETIIKGNTAVFVSRAAALTGAAGSVTTPLPENYNVAEE